MNDRNRPGAGISVGRRWCCPKQHSSLASQSFRTMPTTRKTSSLDNAGFAKLWKSLYDPALALSNVKLTPNDDTDTSLHSQRVVAILQAMCKLNFGVDEGKKSIAIVYGEGCLELTLKLVSTARVGYPSFVGDETDSDAVGMSQQQHEAVWRSGLKMVKCSVIRCRVGRARCRTAGVFGFIKRLLQMHLDQDNAASLVEECMTTLAAICLGDDLNALQVCTCIWIIYIDYDRCDCMLATSSFVSQLLCRV